MRVQSSRRVMTCGTLLLTGASLTREPGTPRDTRSVRTKIPGDFGAGGLILDEAFTAQQSLCYTSPGHFWCWVLPDGRVSVRKADPVVWISGELLIYFHAGWQHPLVSLRCKSVDDAAPGAIVPLGHAPIGDVIRIDTAERPYVYVVTKCISEADHVWEARWPD